LHFCFVDLAVWWQHWVGSLFTCWTRLSWFYAIQFWQTCTEEKRTSCDYSKNVVYFVYNFCEFVGKYCS